MEQPGLNERHRDKNGEISRKHGNTLVRTLRKAYGIGFAAGSSDEATLQEVLTTLDDHSLSQVVHDHEAGHLGQKIAAQPNEAEFHSSEPD